MEQNFNACSCNALEFSRRQLLGFEEKKMKKLLVFALVLSLCAGFVTPALSAGVVPRKLTPEDNPRRSFEREGGCVRHNLLTLVY